jgi:hypothetical protein
MSAPLYSLEESLERATIQSLQGITALAAMPIVPADRSEETDLPQITVRAEREGEVVLGMGTYNARLAVTLATSADETPEEERAGRRLPDDEDDDEGAAGFKLEWKLLSDTVTAPAFKESLNTQALVHVWGIEQEPISYENQSRSFARTVNLRVWCNPAYATPPEP